MAEDSKGRLIGYWILTALAALAMIGGGVADIMLGPDVVAALEGLGYPTYVGPMIGTGKVLGGLIILAPKVPRLKEWAYAGIAIDLVGATWSHAANGDAVNFILTPVVILAIALGSWWLRPSNRKLAG